LILGDEVVEAGWRMVSVTTFNTGGWGFLFPSWPPCCSGSNMGMAGIWSDSCNFCFAPLFLGPMRAGLVMTPPMIEEEIAVVVVVMGDLDGGTMGLVILALGSESGSGMMGGMVGLL
jgi:hypothetical protein